MERCLTPTGCRDGWNLQAQDSHSQLKADIIQLKAYDLHHRQYYLGVGGWGVGLMRELVIPYTLIQVEDLEGIHPDFFLCPVHPLNANRFSSNLIVKLCTHITSSMDQCHLIIFCIKLNLNISVIQVCSALFGTCWDM